ncbi:MAG: hypothetical protein ACKVT0_13495 [Planctomycetaceae bacterium]
MSSTYTEILRNRHDLSDWLIHFTRDSEGKPAREVLRSILIEGVLRPGFALRGDSPRPTIYGPNSAVCFSEQPLWAFLEYLHARQNSSAMAGYGLLVHKHDVYVAGGLPVIYGLSESKVLTSGDKGYCPSQRQLRSNDLPFDQQYRYVAYAPTRSPEPLDWTHEREWRWPCGRPSNEFYLTQELSHTDRGHFMSRVHAFVDHDEDIRWLQEELHAAFESEKTKILENGSRNGYTNRWKEHLANVHLISLDTARHHDVSQRFWRFEDWPAEKKYPLISR